MPYTPATPPSGTVKTTQQVSMDTYQIHTLSFNLDPDDATNISILVVWSKGYLDEGTYVMVESYKDNFSGAAVLAKMAEVPSGETMHEAVKSRIWALLSEEGKIESGSVV